MADIFVTRDQRMLGKIRVAFRFLKADCVVCSVDEFTAFVEGRGNNEAQSGGAPNA